MTFRALTVGILFLLNTTSHAGELSYPKLFFRYSFLYDRICSPNQPVDSTHADEAQRRESEFTAIWEKEAPLLFERVFKNFGRGFSRKEMTATLSVCPDAPSFSDPLVLTVVKYLKASMGERPVRPDYAFADLVFHELLHTWLDENLGSSTPLLEKYNNEPSSVRDHLHLMAIQILVYKELGRKDLSDWINWLYSNMSGVYPRAWEIVNTEGYEKFVAEIR